LPPTHISTLFPTRRSSDLLGVQAALGRVFLPEEDTPGKPLTVVITDGLWKQRFGSDPNIIGRKLNLGTDSYTIVGVMPKNFSLRSEEHTSELQSLRHLVCR